MNLNLSNEIKSSKVVVHKPRYAYLKCKEQFLGDHFLISKDEDEITIVTKEENLKDVPYEDEVKWFRLFEIKTNTPFLCVGFIATITKAIADKGINILVVSTFSKDYILIKEEKTEQAINALKEIGFEVISE